MNEFFGKSIISVRDLDKQKLESIFDATNKIIDMGEDQRREIARGKTLGYLFLILFGLSNLVLFGGIYWSKFAHMFYKPGAAIQKRLAEADGSNENLPYPTDKPKQFGLGIKRDAPKHY